VLKDKRHREIFGIFIFLVGIILFLSIASYVNTDYKAVVLSRDVSNLIGPVGALFAHLFRSAFGITSYIFTIMIFISGWTLFKHGEISSIKNKLFSLLFLIIALSSFLAIGNDTYQNSGGFAGYYIYNFFKSATGIVGAYLIIIFMNIVAFILLGIVSFTTILENKKIHQSSERLKKLFSRFSIKNYEDQIPLDTIGKESQKKKKMPWIMRKKIVIVEKDNAIKEDSIKYLGMNVSAAAGESFFEDENDAAAFYEDDIDYETKMLMENDPDEDFVLDSDNISFSAEGDPIVTEEYYERGNFEEYEEYEEGEVLELESDAAVIDKAIADENSLKKNRIYEIDEDIENQEDETFFSDTDEIIPEEQVFKPLKINKEYIIPTSFLHNSEPIDSETWEIEVKKNSQLLVRALADFGIESRIVNVNRGPVITLYEMQIAAGIKINRVVSLADDIAMALAAYRVRIVAPIPGKSAIGVELPNIKREMVTLGDIVKSKLYKEQKGTLKVALGEDILGTPVMIDLKNQPHLLIAGATGAGKSVCVNSIITSIVYNYDPNYVRFILVDPKMVELQLYNGTPHLLTPVITEPHLTPAVLKWAIFEMDRRYRLLAAMNSRDILSYNDKISKERNGGEKIPFIIIIIDELADLMMVASKDIEGYITRIAQKARAVGIHLVLATQRPSVDVITGIIKANFPARIAFQVAQKTDSRTIIDQNGAEKLLGKGDMLYQSPMSSYPVRIQGAFISEDEVMAVVTHLRTLGTPDYIDFEESVFQDDDGEINDENDELFVEALKIIEETRKASASYLQRRLSIGYNRAARIIEKMEELGYIGPQQGSKPRDIFI
jgi:S-DNA-T family DNA segregation ATPase FtsK/SpoIIIE